MSWLQNLLAHTPQSDVSWQCPWFQLIEFFAGVGVVFGLISYLVDDSIFGLLAIFIGLGSGAFTFGTRRKGTSSC